MALTIFDPVAYGVPEGWIPYAPVAKNPGQLVWAERDESGTLTGRNAVYFRNPLNDGPYRKSVDVWLSDEVLHEFGGADGLTGQLMARGFFQGEA